MAEAPKSQIFTVIVVSDHSQAVRKFRVPRRWLQNLGWTAVVVGVFALLTGGHYVSLLGASSENSALKEENAQLRSQVLLVQEKVAHISATLDRVERFDAKLRTAVTTLQDPERNLAIGPVASASQASSPRAASSGCRAFAPRASCRAHSRS